MTRLLSASQLSQLDAEEQELLTTLKRRREIRVSFSEWCRHRGFAPAHHHRIIIAEIEDFLEDADLEVLLLLAPPGSAKSTYVSILFPTWYLVQHPTHAILAATHSDEFAQRWGRAVRNSIELEHDVLGIQLSRDSTANDRWSLADGGEYYGVGAGSGISGFRADLAHLRRSLRLPRGCLQRADPQQALGLVSSTTRNPAKAPSAKQRQSK